jgi:hypothetical protein
MTTTLDDEAREYERMDVARHHIEEAIRIHNARGYWPFALTLARAAASFLGDLLRSDGGKGWMSAMHGGLQKDWSMSFSVQALKDSLVGKADHFSHFNDRTLKEPVVTVNESDLIMAIFAGVAEFHRATGSLSGDMVAWLRSHFIRHDLFKQAPGFEEFLRHAQENYEASAASPKLQS